MTHKVSIWLVLTVMAAFWTTLHTNRTRQRRQSGGYRVRSRCRRVTNQDQHRDPQDTIPRASNTPHSTKEHKQVVPDNVSYFTEDTSFDDGETTIANASGNASLNSESDITTTGNDTSDNLHSPALSSATLLNTPQLERVEHEASENTMTTVRHTAIPKGMTKVEAAPLDTVVIPACGRSGKRSDEGENGLDASCQPHIKLDASDSSTNNSAETAPDTVLTSTPPGLPPPAQPRTSLRATAEPFIPRSHLSTSRKTSSPAPPPRALADDILDSTPYCEKYWNWAWYDSDETLKSMVERALREAGAGEEGTMKSIIEDQFRDEIEIMWKEGLEKWERKRRERKARWNNDDEEECGQGFMWTTREPKGVKKSRRPFQYSTNLDMSGSKTPFKPMRPAFQSIYSKKQYQTSSQVPMPKPAPMTWPSTESATDAPSCEGFWPADSIRERAYTYLKKRTDTQNAAEEAYTLGDLEKSVKLVVEEHRAYEIGVLFHDAAAALLFFVKNEGYFTSVQEAMGSWRSGFTKKVKEMLRREREKKERSGESFEGNGSSEGSSDEESLSIHDSVASASFDDPRDPTPAPINLALPIVNPSKLRKCDLHGLLIREARHYVLQHLELCRKHRIENTDVVTGWGKSSKDNDAKLKPRVKEILEKYEEDSEGRVMIDRKKKNEGMFTLRMSGW